jgi:hypothetical protein
MNTYTTKDIYLSAFLIARGALLDSYSRVNGITTFRFPEKHELLQLIEEYYADHAMVSPMRYGNSLKNLKAMIHSTNTDTNYGKEHMYHIAGENN